MSPSLWWSVFAAAVGVSLFGDVAMKRASAGGPDWAWFAAGFVAYSATSGAWLVLLRDRKLSTVGTLYPVANMAGLLVLGAWIFGERLSPREWLGVALAGCAFVLMGGNHG